MPEGGTLIFSTVVVEIDESWCRRQAMPITPGSYAQIRVADTGVGMDPEMSKRVFEPFFTTKDVGRGTGLGLAAVYGTVNSHGGAIDVRSRPGEGATFTIHLPITRPRSSAGGTPPEGTWMEGRGTLLLVDDEPEVRRVTANILERLGYLVITADDGVAALETWERNRERVRLVLLDVRMPRLDGAETLRRLRKLSPALPVVIVSGFGADRDLQTIREIGVQGVVEKPFTVAELSEAVARALERAR
jgi:two-component system cell cycle sensor histidine kinase/response regulator CckA